MTSPLSYDRLRELPRKVGLFFARLWWAQHNARVLADMEWRMTLLVEEATGGRMSKPYYSIDQMRPEIAAHHNRVYQDGWDDALADDDTQGTCQAAADLLDQYAGFIRDDVKADDLERHPYLPLIEDTAAALRALSGTDTGEKVGG